MVMEAVGVKTMMEDAEQRKKLEEKNKREEWKNEKSPDLEAMREG